MKNIWEQDKKKPLIKSIINVFCAIYFICFYIDGDLKDKNSSLLNKEGCELIQQIKYCELVIVPPEFFSYIMARTN